MTPYRVAILALGLAGCAWFSTSPSQEPKPTAPAAVERPPV